jgi:hypothetical protein
MGITFHSFSAGDTTSVTAINSNFTLINTYLSDGVPVTDLSNEYADVIIGPFTVDALGINSGTVIRMKPPPMTTTLVPVRAMISFDAGTGDATMNIKVNGTTIMLSAGALVAATSATVATADSFATGATISANQTLSFHIIESSTSATISGITAMLWCKTKHRG